MRCRDITRTLHTGMLATSIFGCVCAIFLCVWAVVDSDPWSGIGGGFWIALWVPLLRRDAKRYWSQR